VPTPDPVSPRLHRGCRSRIGGCGDEPILELPRQSVPSVAIRAVDAQAAHEERRWGAMKLGVPVV